MEEQGRGERKEKGEREVGERREGEGEKGGMTQFGRKSTPLCSVCYVCVLVAALSVSAFPATRDVLIIGGAVLFVLLLVVVLLIIIIHRYVIFLTCV